MQKIGNLINLNQEKTCSPVILNQSKEISIHATTSSHSSASHSRRKCIDLLFSRFAAIYGHLWRSQFKTEEFLEFGKKEWMDGLSAFDSDILLKAIIQCREAFATPPTLPLVIEVCRKLKKRNDFVVANPNFKAVKSDVVAYNIQRCRALLSK